MTEPDAKDVQKFQDLVGQEVDQISFVRDHLQIGFNGPLITAFGATSAVIDGQGHEFPDVGARDAMCQAIGLTVTSAIETPENLLVDTGYVRFVISKAPRTGVTAVLLTSHNGFLLQSWP